MIPGLVARGRRVVAPDLVGFGRSDKPSLRSDYTYARHVEWTRELLFDRLDLTSVTLFAQDWGSLIGLRLVGEHPQRFARVAIGNGGLPTGDEPMGEAFLMWQEYSQNTPDLHVGGIVSGGCVNRLAPEVVAAYDAPFPDDSFKEGARQFPLLVPTSPEDPAHDANVAAWAVLAASTSPSSAAIRTAIRSPRAPIESSSPWCPAQRVKPTSPSKAGGTSSKRKEVPSSPGCSTTSSTRTPTRSSSRPAVHSTRVRVVFRVACSSETPA